MPFSQTVHITIEKQTSTKLTFVFNYQERSPQLDIVNDRIEVNVTGPHFQKKLRWELDFDRGSLAFIDASILNDPHVICVAKCLGVAISKIVAECVWAHWGDSQKIMECIKSKAAGAMLDAGACVADCFLTGGTSP